MRKTIYWRKGNGTSILGIGIVLIMLFFFFAVFNLYMMKSEAYNIQLAADSMSDAIAVYGYSEKASYTEALDELNRIEDMIIGNTSLLSSDFDGEITLDEDAYKERTAYVTIKVQSSPVVSLFGDDFTITRDSKTSFGIKGGDAESIIMQAKIIADYVRENNFTYGDARINPAFDCSEKVVSCDRFVGWVLYNCGYTDQPYWSGLVVEYGLSNDLRTWLESQGFSKITSESDLCPGDIIISRNSAGHYHTFIIGNEVSSGVWERYDCGNLARIQGTQPYTEGIYGFVVAYRAP